MKPYSVLMAVYQKEKAEYLKESIVSMVSQTVPADEIVIVCDGPLTDALDQVIEEMTNDCPGLFRIVRLKRQGGLGNALKTGVDACRNEWIVRMDSDDISVSDRCERQFRAQEQTGADLVGGFAEEFTEDISDSKASRTVPETDGEIRRFARRRNPFNHPTVMFRKSAVLTAGGYRDCGCFEDYDLWTRMLGCGAKGYNIQKTLVYMRAGDGMYARRGGLRYALRGVNARWRIYRGGYCGLWDFLVSSGGQVLVSLIPVKCRSGFYRRFLRR